MVGIRQSEFESYGCPFCGCSFVSCYSGSPFDRQVTCGECEKEFNIVKDEYMDDSKIEEYLCYKKIAESSIDLMKNHPDLIEDDPGLIEETKSYLEAINVYLNPYKECVPHPRKGTPKHELVVPDVRPEDGIGDYCTPRGIGYDLACFVKSKEAGQRITDMINKISEEYGDKGFSCWLDYRENEPLWIQVKIDYEDKTRAIILSSNIAKNDYIITEDIVRKVLTMSDEECQEYLEELKSQREEYIKKKATSK